MGARLALELARRCGLVGSVVSLDPGGFWQEWERTYFATNIGASPSFDPRLRWLDDFGHLPHWGPPDATVRLILEATRPQSEPAAR